jgi:hypothetical protein
MKRWTIRNVEPMAIEIVQELAKSTGASLGEVISLVIELGGAAARPELQARRNEEELFPMLRQVQILQDSMAELLREIQIDSLRAKAR